MSTLTQKKDNINGNTGMIVKRVSVPIGLEELMEGLSKEVILRKPKDIYLFASEYFTKLINLREKSNIYKSHPVRAIQSVTKVKHEYIPPVTKISTARPTKHLSRQLSIHSKSPIRQKLIQNETTTKRNITKSRDRKINTDKKDPIAREFPKTALPSNVSRASNNKGGTSTGTSSVQSTPREKKQPLNTRKVKSSLINDPNKDREINNKTHKIQKRNKNEIVKTALIVPTVIGGGAVAANIVEAVEDNIIKEKEKNPIMDSTDLAESAKLSPTTKKVNNTGLLEGVFEQVGKGNTDKLELNDQSIIKESLDSDILAQSTNVTEVTKNIYRSEGEPETLRNQKIDIRVNGENNSLGREGEQLKDEKATAEHENNQEKIIQETKRIQKSHDDETSPNITDQNPISINSSQSSVDGNNLELGKTDIESIQDRLPENISTKELLVSNKDIEKQSENEKNLIQSPRSETVAEGLRNDNKLQETGENILDKISESIVEVDAKKEDKNLKSDERKNDISSEKKVGISDITIQKKGTTEVKDILGDEITDDHPIPMSETESSDTMHSNLRIGDLISEQRSDVAKGTEAQNNIVDIDICHEFALMQEQKENKLQESKMAENVIMPEKRKSETSMETKEIQDIQESMDNTLKNHTSTHEIIKEGKVSDLKNKNTIDNSDGRITSVTSEPTIRTPDNKSITTSESQGSDTEVKDKVQESQMDMAEEQTKDSENVKKLNTKTVEHEPSDLLTNVERKNSSESNEDQLKEFGLKEKTIQASAGNEQNNESEGNDVLNINDQVNPVETADLSNETHIQNNKFTIKMEKSASVKSDDVLTVSILDNVGPENISKESHNGEDNTFRSVENIATSSNDTKQEKNQLFRKDEELAIKEDDKTKIKKIESSDSKIIEGSQGRSEKNFENIGDAPSDHPYEMDSPRENVSDVSKNGISPESKVEIGDTKYVKEIDQEPLHDDLPNKPYLPSTEKETAIDNLHTENANSDQNNKLANHEVTKKIINYELSKNLPGLIDSPIKHFLGSFINNEQINVFKNKDIVSLENDKLSKNMTSKEKPEERVSKREDEDVKEEKATNAESNKNSKGILPTDSIEGYAGNPLVFSSVKDLLDFDSDNALKSNITKKSKSQDNVQALEQDRSNSQMVENERNDTKTLENDPIKNNDLIKNEETQEKNKIGGTQDKETQEGTSTIASSLQKSTESEIISKEFDHVNEENINIEENAKKSSENAQIDEQTKSKIDNLETHSKMSTPINEENTTEQNTKETVLDMHNTTTAKSVEDNIGSEKEENINSSGLGNDKTDDQLKEINEILGSDYAPENTIKATKAPEYVDKKDDTLDQIDNEKIIKPALKSENLIQIKTTRSEGNSTDTILNSQQPQKEAEQFLSRSNIMNTETHNNLQIDSTETKVSDNSETKDDEVDNNILKIRNSENDIISTNNHSNFDGSKEILSEDVTTRMFTNNDVENNRKNLSLDNIDTFKEDARHMEINNANQQQSGEIASALNTIKNIMASNISVQKPGVLDTSVSQYLNLFLGNEQSNVFQNTSIEPNKSEVNIDKSKKQSGLKNNKLIPEENVKKNSTGSKIKKGNTNDLNLKKMERSYSQNNVWSNDGHISESAIKTTKMRRVRSVGLIKSAEIEHKSKIPTSARRSASRRPLIRQLDTDSKEIEEKLGIKMEDKVNQDGRRKSDEDDQKIVLQNSENIKKKMLQGSDETETDKIKDKHQEDPKEPIIEKNINKIDIRQDAVTKEDVLIAKTILKGIEGAEKHIELIEEKITPNDNINSETDYIKSDNEKNTKLVTEDSTHPRVVDTSVIDTNNMNDKKENIIDIGQQETMLQKKYESQNKTNVKSEPKKKERLLENRAHDKVMTEEGIVSNTLIESDPQPTINKIVAAKTLPLTSEGVDAEKNHIIDSYNVINSNQSYDIKDKRAEINQSTENVQKSEQENPEKYILENVTTDDPNKTTTHNAQKENKIKDIDDGAEDIEQAEAIVQDELKAHHLKESNAAVKIQSLWRGYVTRKIRESSDLRFNQKSNRLKLKQEEAILKIQAVARGYLDRLKYKRLKEKNATISKSADILSNGTQEVKVSYDEKSFDTTKEINLRERKVISDNNVKTFSVENNNKKESGENLDNDINPALNNDDITDKEKISFDIRESNSEEQPQASRSENTNKNTLLNQEEHVNDDILETLTTQNEHTLPSLMQNGYISETNNTDKIKEKITSDKPLDPTTAGRNHGEDIEKKLNVTENLEGQGEKSTDKNEQEQNMKAAGSQDISADANTINSEASHDSHFENTFTSMVNQKDSEDRETKSIDMYTNNDDDNNDKQKVVNINENIEKGFNGHINKGSLINGEITSSYNNLNDNNVDKEKESIEHIELEKNLNNENVSDDDLNKQSKPSVKDTRNGSKLSEELIESKIGDQNLGENALNKHSVKDEKNINNNPDQGKNESKEIESVNYNNTEDNLYNAVNISHDKINNKQVSETTKLDNTTDQNSETFKQEHNIHEDGRDKPYFYRSDTVVEPNNVKKIVSQLGKRSIEHQDINDDIELNAKDDNNNTETKEETALESEVRSTVNKILNDNIKPSMEIEIKEAVKNIMENNIDNNKPTSENNSTTQLEIEKESENVEKNKETVMLSQVSHDVPEHIHNNMIATLEENGTQTLSSEINEQSDKTTSDDVSQGVLHDILKEGISNSIPPTDKDESTDQSGENDNNAIQSMVLYNGKDSSERGFKNDIGTKNIEENETHAILSETNLQSETPTNHIGQTILFDASKKEKWEDDFQTKKDQETLYQTKKKENNIILSADLDTDRDSIEKSLQNDTNTKNLTKNETETTLLETNVQPDKTTIIGIHQTTLQDTLMKGGSENLTPTEKDQSTKNENNGILSQHSDNASDLGEKDFQSNIDLKNIDAIGTQALLSATNVQPGKTIIDINQTNLPDMLETGASDNLTPTEKDQSTKKENNVVLSTAPDNASDLREKPLQSDIDLNNIEPKGTQAMISETNVQPDKTIIHTNQTTPPDMLETGASDNLTPTEKNQSTKKGNNVLLTAPDNASDLREKPLQSDIHNIDANGPQPMISETNVQPDKTIIDINQTTPPDMLEIGASDNLNPTETDQSTKKENNFVLSTVLDNASDSSKKHLQSDIDLNNIDPKGTQAMISATNVQPDKTIIDINQTTPLDMLETGASDNLTPTDKDLSTKKENNVLSTAPDNASDLRENPLQSDIHNIDANGTQPMISETNVQPDKTIIDINQTTPPDMLETGASDNLTPTEKDQSTKKENNVLSTAPDNASDLREKPLQSDIHNIDANGTQPMISETNVQPDKTIIDMNQTTLPNILETGASENLTPTEKEPSTKNENNVILSTAPENTSDLNEKDLQSDMGPMYVDKNETPATISETTIQSDKTENDTALHNTLKEAISYHVAPTEKDQTVDQSTINKSRIILSPTLGNVNALSESDLKDDKDPSHSEINADDVSSVDSVDSVITVIPNVNYDTSVEMKHVSSGHNSTLPNRSLSEDIIKDNKEDSNKNLMKKSLSTDALDGHVELLDQVQKTLLDQICGKPVNTASKFDIEQLRKELHEASSLYKEENEDPDFAAHHDELLEYLSDFEPEDENSYDSKIIKTPIRELPDIEEEIDASAEDTETIARRVLESKSDQQTTEFCKTPSITSVEKCIDNKPLKDHVEILNLEKLKEGHNEIVIKNDNIQINRTESSDPGKQITEENNQKLLHSSELHDSVMIPMDSSSRSALVHSGHLRHTSEFHDTLVVPLPSGSDVNIKNEAKEMLANDKLPEPTKTESVDTGNQTAFQQSPAGAPIVTSRRSSQDGVDDVEAQASLRDTSSAKPNSVESFTHQSQPQLPRFVKQDMESENNNKRNNAICKRVSSPGKNMEAEAATKIQAGFRGYQVRKQMKSKNVADKSNLERHQLRRKSSGRKIMKDTDLVEKSAVKIQAGVRGFLVRRRQKKQLNSSASA